MSAVDLLRSLPDQSIDALITDPPYGLAAAPPIKVSRLTHKGRGGVYNRVTETWDHYVPLDWMAETARVLKPGGSVIVFSGSIGIAKIIVQADQLGWKMLNSVVWHKPDAPPNFTGRMMTEAGERFVWLCPSGKGWTYNRSYAKSINGGKNLRDIWTLWSLRGKRLHKTQKPMLLMERIINLFTKPGDVVVDPYCGSGTTLLAAKLHGRHYIGSDITQEYVEKAITRLAPISTLPLFNPENAQTKQESMFLD